MLIPHKGHTDTIQVYSVTVMTHVKALQAGHSSQGTSEPITPACYSPSTALTATSGLHHAFVRLYVNTQNHGEWHKTAGRSTCTVTRHTIGHTMQVMYLISELQYDLSRRISFPLETISQYK